MQAVDVGAVAVGFADAAGAVGADVEGGEAWRTGWGAGLAGFRAGVLRVVTDRLSFFARMRARQLLGWSGLEQRLRGGPGDERGADLFGGRGEFPGFEQTVGGLGQGFEEGDAAADELIGGQVVDEGARDLLGAEGSEVVEGDVASEVDAAGDSGPFVLKAYLG